jgi:peptidoglycan/xylan/chitin deacetylase (PgdA/CDA1 family)
MDQCGVAFGTHTLTHRILTLVPESVARREIVESKAYLESALHRPCRLFAYPNGNHSDATRRLLAEAGFSRAFTTDPGAWTPGSDPLEIPRLNVSESDVVGPAGRFSAAMFEYTVFWRVARALLAQGGGRAV